VEKPFETVDVSLFGWMRLDCYFSFLVLFGCEWVTDDLSFIAIRQKVPRHLVSDTRNRTRYAGVAETGPSIGSTKHARSADTPVPS